MIENRKNKSADAVDGSIKRLCFPCRNDLQPAEWHNLKTNGGTETGGVAAEGLKRTREVTARRGRTGD